MSQDRIDAISARTASGGGEIVKLLERGSAFYAPGSAAAVMAESVLNDRRRLLPASCLLTGQYGLSDIYIGVPCIIGSNATCLGSPSAIVLTARNPKAPFVRSSSWALKKKYATRSAEPLRPLAI